MTSRSCSYRSDVRAADPYPSRRGSMPSAGGAHGGVSREACAGAVPVVESWCDGTGDSGRPKATTAAEPGKDRRRDNEVVHSNDRELQA
jgi:hypothetical protein